MIKIKAADLREFVRLSKGVSKSTIIPVLQYVFCNCVGDTMTLCKSNQETIVTHNMDAEFVENVAFLVDDRLLTTFIASATDDVFIYVDGCNIALASGGVRVDTTFPPGAVQDYPAPPTTLSEMSFLLDKGFLKSVGIAGTYVAVLDNNPLAYCYILPSDTGSVVIGSDGFIFYLAAYDLELPPVVLSKEATALVSTFDALQYYSYQNYNVFSAGKTTYAFIKPTYLAIPYKAVTDRIRDKGEVTIERKEVIKFCETAQGVSTNKWTTGIIENAFEGVTLSCVEDSVSLSNTIPAEKTFSPSDFRFNTRYMLHVVKSFPGEKLRMEPVDDSKGTAYVVRSDQEKHTMALIMGVV